MAEDFYQTLGVTRESSKDEIRKAYRKMAHKHHPDKDGGDEEQFKKVNEAYSVLSDDQKKSQYDQFGQTVDNNGAGEGNPFNGQGMNINMEDIDLGDIFGSFFGGRRRASQTRQGSDVQIDVTISFKESATGTKKEVSHRIYQPCSHCRGNGAEPGTPITECKTCSGQGVTTKTRQTPLGAFSQRVVCPECEGEGKKAEEVCTTCRGAGREMQDRTLEIDIPAGIADGQTIRITGKGEAPPKGGIPGDLYANIHVQQDENLKRDGNNVRTNITISFSEATLGTEKTIQTLQEERKITIPAGTQPGTELRFDQKGFQSLNGTAAGDHLVTIQVEVPKRISKKQKELLKEFEESNKKGFF